MNLNNLEVKELNHIFFFFLQEWTDYNLMWNESEYGGVKDLRITPNKLWKPDILMYNRYNRFCSTNS